MTCRGHIFSSPHYYFQMFPGHPIASNSFLLSSLFPPTKSTSFYLPLIFSFPSFSLPGSFYLGQLWPSCAVLGIGIDQVAPPTPGNIPGLMWKGHIFLCIPSLYYCLFPSSRQPHILTFPCFLPTHKTTSLAAPLQL